MNDHPRRAKSSTRIVIDEDLVDENENTTGETRENADEKDEEMDSATNPEESEETDCDSDADSDSDSESDLDGLNPVC